MPKLNENIQEGRKMKRSKMRAKRLRNLVVVSSLIAIILTVSTYAWFIGMRSVNVSSFDVEIATTDSLLLSLDGENWDTEVSISQATLNEVSYAGHTNTWGGERGLIPVSSVGAMDNTVSRMKLFEKASLTATPGGYRLMASRVNNMGAAEQDGYVAFDLFIKNFSGTQYIQALNELDEEAIYLTVDSEVAVAAGGVADTGIENSVRVAFAQIGRVAGTTTTPATITGITCTSAGVVTGICRTAQIWEPNDTKHEANAISWYNTSCLARKADPDGEDVTDPDSFLGNCQAVADGVAYDTYAISDAITSADMVDVYDGPDYNTYTGSASLLVAYPYFTDTMKELAGMQRPLFMTLAPNSITKVRIYIYIEGQDVDNYDFASIGKKIAVNFGFTKERFVEGDIDYEGPDFTPPVITLTGATEITLNVLDEYTELGATALDNVDGNITANIEIDATDVDTSQAGIYYVTYNVSDAAGNASNEVRRTVVVVAE